MVVLVLGLKVWITVTTIIECEFFGVVFAKLELGECVLYGISGVKRKINFVFLEIGSSVE